MVLLAPKQGTYQLEQQLLSTADLAGYTRLSIVSFESLARLILDRTGRPAPSVLSDEGQVMVLRGLLSRQRDNLKLFRASARLTGFALQLREVLSELQHAGLTPTALDNLALQLQDQGLRGKLQDLAFLLEGYLRWLDTHELQDPEAVLKAAAESLRENGAAAFRLAALWVDGFAEFSPLELDLLAAVLPYCKQATLTFCLDRTPSRNVSWLSHWTVTERAFESCRKRFASLSGFTPAIQLLPGGAPTNRFSQSPVFQHLRDCWDAPQPYKEPNAPPDALAGNSGTLFSVAAKPDQLRNALTMVQCVDREAEAVMAAREILKFVHRGGRFREISVLVRDLEPYYQIVRRVFGRYEIPFFLDRRESVSHHPLAELTRSALRVVTFGWQQEDWFAALKSGLVRLPEEEIDLLENEALARGWKGHSWLERLRLKDTPKSPQDAERLQKLGARLEKIRQETVPPFKTFGNALAAVRNRPTGPQLAAALAELWESLGVQQQLQNWSDAERPRGAWQSNAALHETVWNQMNAWLENAELAFATEALLLREWLPILEAGLTGLSVGIIPPALDQVLVGAVDRSRTPEVKLAIVLGLNEGVFPAKPQSGRLLTDADRVELEQYEVALGPNARRQLGRERYLGYIACTRARERLVLTWASVDAAGVPLNPSSLIPHLRRLFPALAIEQASSSVSLGEAQHASELVGTLLRADGAPDSAWKDQVQQILFASVPGLATTAGGLGSFTFRPDQDVLAPELAERLYGPALRTSVSRMEQFAACPFRFFIHSGLRAEERKLFQLDAKEQGTFQHEVLALFHQLLHREGKRWRDITPEEGRALVGKIAFGLMTDFRQGLLQTSEQARFTARVLTESLQEFVEILIVWMREQYQFDPVAVELPFGNDGAAAWSLELEGGKRLEVYGRIDRIDLYREPGNNRALCVVLDYKSSEKQLDALLVQHGLQLQLLTYLNVVRQWPDPQRTFEVNQIEPAGVFYVSLRGRYGSGPNRREALEDPKAVRKMAYRHAGRFDHSVLPQLDGRPGIQQGDQFSFRLTKAGQVYKGSKEAMSASAFRALLSQSENILRDMGRRIYAGAVEVGPYRKGSVTACDQCRYHAICRVDPWTQHFRLLTRETDNAGAADLPE